MALGGRFILIGSCCIACQSAIITFAEEHGKNLNCSFDPECLPDLVCAFQRCHRPCTASRDCPTGQRCVQVRDQDAGAVLGQVCQLSDETRCTLNSQCPDPQTCGVDGRCRDECQTASDCVASQVCIDQTCADPEELDDGGMLPRMLDGG